MTHNDVLKTVSPKERLRLLALERKFRASGQWGHWETIALEPGQGGAGWAGACHQARRNRCFAVLVRLDSAGVVHLAVSSLSGVRPTWREMQRIKDEIAGPETTAIEVYPPKHEVVDEADMFHIWVLRGGLPFGLHLQSNSGVTLAEKHDALAARSTGYPSTVAGCEGYGGPAAADNPGPVPGPKTSCRKSRCGTAGTT